MYKYKLFLTGPFSFLEQFSTLAVLKGMRPSGAFDKKTGKFAPHVSRENYAICTNRLIGEWEMAVSNGTFYSDMADIIFHLDSKEKVKAAVEIALIKRKSKKTAKEVFQKYKLTEKEKEMKSTKKLIGYKLTKAYPGSPVVGTKVGANDKIAPLLPEFYTPIYKQLIEEESSSLVLGSNSIRFVITSGRVFDDTHGEEVDMDEVEELLENIQNLRDCNVGEYNVYVTEDWRWIRIGCAEENNRFSPDEIKKLYDEYRQINR